MAPTRAATTRAATRQQPSIEHFGRISKATPKTTTSKTIAKKRKIVEEAVRPAKEKPVHDASSIDHAPPSRPKRKRALETPEPQRDDNLESLSRPEPSDPSRSSRSGKKDTRKKQRTTQQPSTPGRDAFDRFANLALDSPRRQTRLKFPTAMTPPPELPDELQDIIGLNSAFLTALSLHYAHNGTSSPADLAQLCPSVSNVWGKRKVSTSDIQLCLGLLQFQLGARKQLMRHFKLSDFGKRKICIETVMDGEENGIFGGYVDEKKLSSRFRATLTDQWGAWSGSDARNASVEQFIDQLPREAIQQDPSLEKMAPLYSKGQQRLADLKAGVAALQASEEAKKAEMHRHAATLQSQPAQQNHQAVQSRASSLLDRILAKQQSSANSPAPLSREQQDRNRALQRCQEVANIISLMAASKGGMRASFSLQSLVQNLQGSVRNPISKEEAESAVELLAGPVAPGYMSIARMGSVKGVVVNPMMKPTASIMQDRIEGAMARN